MKGLSVRRAREQDLDRLIEIHACAYPDPRGVEARRRNFLHNPLGSFDDLHVVEDRGAVVGHGFLFSLSTWLGGREVDVGGIASVAVAPEARGRRIASFLLSALHEEIAERGKPLALLYPFREGFYSRLGYAPTAPFVRARIDPSAFTPRLRLEPGAPSAYSRVPIDASRLRAMEALYHRAACASSGRIARSEARWIHLVADERRHWVGVEDDAGVLAGYAAFTYDAPETYGPVALVVRELVAEAPAARLAVLELLSRQRDQVDEIVLTLASDDPLVGAFLDAPGARRGSSGLEHPLGAIGTGPMVRLTDAKAALAARGYAADGELSLGIVADDARETWRLVVQGGRAEASPSHEKPDFEVRSDTLASIVASGIRPSEAVHLGRARASSGSVVALADAIFAGPRFLCLDPF